MHLLSTLMATILSALFLDLNRNVKTSTIFTIFIYETKIKHPLNNIFAAVYLSREMLLSLLTYLLHRSQSKEIHIS